MPLSPREELLQIQKSLFRRNQRLINESILIKEADFNRYEAAYKRFVRAYRSIATIEEMMQACRSADIIYVGDYHTCNQSQRSFLRILKEVVKREKNFMIGMELLPQRHQKILDTFLKGKMSEATFLKKVGLKKHWVFDLWENFKPIFDFAKYYDLSIYGIDASARGATIRARDKSAAELLGGLLAAHPGKKIFVFIGDLHIAPPHLPQEVEKVLRRLGLSKKSLTLYQNSESIYWRLAAAGLEHDTEVVRIDEKSFCRVHTPPVILQRSYLNWLEHDEGEIDYADPKHSFMELADRITHFLKIDIGKEKEKVEVYTSGDLSFLAHLRKSRRFSTDEIASIKRQIIASESYYIPKLHIVYLSNLSINHAAEEASHFIKHICSGAERPRELFDAFYANILHEALGFFGSKIINHKRKCYHEKDFLKRVQYLEKTPGPHKRQLEYETALLVYQAKILERRGFAASDMEIFKKREDLFFAVTHALGYILGDKLYYALLDGLITKPELRRLYYDPWKGHGRPFQNYWNLLMKTRETRIPARM